MTARPATDGGAPSPVSDDRIIAIVAEEAGRTPAEIRGDQAFVQDLGLDSLDFIRLVMAVERAFAIKIDDKEAARIRIVDDLLRSARLAPPDPDSGAAA